MAPGSNWFLKSARESAPKIVERPLRGTGADAVAIPEENVAHRLRLNVGRGKADNDRANRRARLTLGARFAGDGDGVGGAGAITGSCGHGFGALLAYGSVPREERWIDPEQVRFHGIGIREKSANEIIGAAGDGGDAIAQQSAGAAFGDAERGAARAELFADYSFDVRTVA